LTSQPAAVETVAPGEGAPDRPRLPHKRSRLAAARASIGRVLINRNYALFMAGGFISATGSWGQSVALSWLVLELGNSEFLLGLTNFAAMVPLLLLSIPAGAIVDRFNHKRLLLISQTGIMASVGVLAAATLAGVRSIPLILITAVTGGLFNAIGFPLWSVFINDLVGPENLRSAVALNSVRFNLTRVIGPAIAGVLLAAYGAGVCMAIAAVSSLAVISAIAAVKVPQSRPKPAPPWAEAMKEGLSFCWADKSALRLLLLTTVVGFLIMPYQTFLSAFVRDILGRGPETLGLLLTSVGAGAIGGALISGRRFAARRPQNTVTVLMLVAGLSLAGLAFTRSMALSMAVLAVLGLSSVAYLAIANATLQLTCPQELLGRVMGVWTVVNAGMQPLGSLVIGAVAETAGLTQALASAGGISAAVAAVAGFGGALRRKRRA